MGCRSTRTTLFCSGFSIFFICSLSIKCTVILKCRTSIKQSASQTSLLSESNFLIESHLASLKLHIITTSDSSDSSAKSCCRSKYMDAVSAVTNYQRVTLGTACLIFSSQHFHDFQAVHFYERFGCFRVSLVLISLAVFILNFLLIILSIFSYFLLCQHISVPHTS